MTERARRSAGVPSCRQGNAEAVVVRGNIRAQGNGPLDWPQSLAETSALHQTDAEEMVRVRFIGSGVEHPVIQRFGLLLMASLVRRYGRT